MVFDGLHNTLVLANSTVANFTESTKSAVFISASKNVILANNTFANNSNREGGALTLTKVNRVDLVSNTFMNNSATLGSGVYNPVADQNSLRGGALFIDCIRSASSTCDIRLSKANRFISNFALIQGGAISISS